MTTLEVFLQIVAFCMLLYLWLLAFLLARKMIFDIPGSAFSRDKQCKFDEGDDLNET